MTDDVGLLLAQLDEPIAVRPAFAASLRRTLHAELGFAPAVTAPDRETATAVPASSPRAAGRPSLIDRLTGSLRPMTPRVALLVAVALLLIACTVAGAWMVASGWISSAPRGVQYTNDFTLTDAYRRTGTSFTSLQLAPDGRSLFTVAQARDGIAGTDPTIVRLDPSASGLAATDIAHLAALTDPALWPAGADLSIGHVVLGPANPGTSPLAVAPDGDLFVGIGLATDPGRSPSSTSVVVVHPDGSAEHVIGIDELTGGGLIDEPLEGGWINVAASSPARLWARAEGWWADGADTDQAAWLFEIVDPNADGTWDDKLIRPLVLPAGVPVVEAGSYAWLYGGFVAEPPTAGRETSDSVLLPLVGSGEYRVYRLVDEVGDGDVTSEGETELVYGGPLNTADGIMQPPILAPRVVDEPAISELLAAGLTRSTRVSRISGSEVTDIVRALPSFAWGVAATRDGSIYVATFADASNGQPSDGAGVIARLTPVPVGAPVPAPSSTPQPAPTSSAATGGSPEASAPTAGDPSGSATSLLPPRQPVTDGVPRIGVWYSGTTPSGDYRNEQVLFGADGSGPSDLLPGTHNEGLCPSVDGEHIAFWSDEEVPNESYLYVDAVGGGTATKVTENAGMVICPFPDEGMLTLETNTAPWRATWHPAQGDATELPLDIVTDGVLSATSDGSWLAVATGPDGYTLSAVDVRTGTAMTIAQLPERVRRAAWSPDASRLVVATGAYDPMDPDASGEFQLTVVDRDTGTLMPLASTKGRAPSLAWSPDGTEVAVNARNGEITCCHEFGDLSVVDVATGATRRVVKDAIFGAWSPADPTTFAYATVSTLFIESPGAPVREVPGPTGRLCPTCRDRQEPEWPSFGAGWSPDGRYIATGEPVVGVIDVATGTYTVLVTDGDNALVDSSRWWP